ncbi:hypothetical protein [Methanoregula sp.]|jgi:hypothetical protein|uniref:hypothetical protein n=1 Tax=Methanoregula sp. TaxID=2052170 RepID=UPI0035652D38
MPLVNDAQALADLYCVIVKKIRIIRKAGEDFVIRPARTIVGSPLPIAYKSHDFEVFTDKYPEIKEVRVIFSMGGAAQFFPAGTPESVIWASNVSTEEMEAD